MKSTSLRSQTLPCRGFRPGRNVLFPVLYIMLVVVLCGGTKTATAGARQFMEKGWNELQQDRDAAAMNYFWMAYEAARKENNTEETAESLLDLGICSYGASYTEGLNYAFRAMEEYRKLEKSSPEKALEGRSKCLQLISTIKSREGKYRESVELSTEALAGFKNGTDTNGYRGLIYNSLGIAYEYLEQPDSSEYYHRLALEERLQTRKFIYLPGSYLKVAAIEMKHGNKEQSGIYYRRALFIADSTGNRQSQVSSLLGLGKWTIVFEGNEKEADNYYRKALRIAAELSDKSFYLSALDRLIELEKQQKHFEEALVLEEERQALKDSMLTWEKQRMVKSLEVQFEVAEKDRQLGFVQQERNIATLTNTLLWSGIGFILLIAAGLIYFLKRINKRDKQLLHTKEALVLSLEEQKKLKEQKMQNEMEFKESQLSIMAIQMLQKNQLLQELKEHTEKENGTGNSGAVTKILSKGINQDKDWADFNTHFESVNKSFYSRLKQAYPDISPNDLKISALIKLNLSIKEMAGILNISPDSVKTARYRLRKKLQLNSEDNLTDFILNLQ